MSVSAVAKHADDLTSQQWAEEPRKTNNEMTPTSKRKQAARTHLGGEPVKKKKKRSLPNLVLRAITIIIGAPAMLVSGFRSKQVTMYIVIFGLFVGSIEWFGLKRHLKVSLLLWGDTGATAAAATAAGAAAGVSEGHHHHHHHLGGNNTEKKGDASGKSAADDDEAASTTSSAGSSSSASSSLIYAADGVPLQPREYPLPITPVSRYAALKAAGWTLIALAAFHSAAAASAVFLLYFLVFIVVTLAAHNRLENTVNGAVERLDDQESPCAAATAVPPPACVGDSDRDSDDEDEAASGEGEGGGDDSEEAEEAGTQRRRPRRLPSPAEIAARQRRHFLAQELFMIAEKQPTEQFLDFSLDIFGFLWLCGLTMPLLCYDVPVMGKPWVVATMVGNFSNDILALLTGRGLREARHWCRRHYGEPTLCSTAAAQSSSTTAAITGEGDSDEKKNRHAASGPPRRHTTGTTESVSVAQRLRRLVMEGPHPLYPAVSPNKSVEGAVAGVVGNAVVFVGTLWLFFGTGAAWPPLSEAPVAPVFASYAFFLLVGVAMGLLGVIGDLLQSLLKRVARVKDAGFIVPGHGGVLDRMDGMLVAFYFMYVSLYLMTSVSEHMGVVGGAGSGGSGGGATAAVAG